MPVLTNEYLSFHPEVPSVFYHYCSVDTFLSIINNSNIWLSDAEKTNDYTEMKWLFSKIHETVEQALLSYQKFFSEEVILKSKKLTYQIAENLLNKKAPIVQNSKSFLACFSESGDLLSQWRAYGNDGNGIAIGFNPSIFEKFKDESYYIMSKVIYSDKDILEFMHSAIDEPLKWAIESSISSKTKELDEMELAMNFFCYFIRCGKKDLYINIIRLLRNRNGGCFVGCNQVILIIVMALMIMVMHIFLKGFLIETRNILVSLPEDL